VTVTFHDRKRNETAQTAASVNSAPLSPLQNASLELLGHVRMLIHRNALVRACAVCANERRGDLAAAASILRHNIDTS
jgi:hypothetical protein